MKLQLMGLPDGSHTFDENLTCDVLELSSDRFPGTVALHVVVSKRGNHIYLTLQSVGDAILKCDRCLDSFTLPINTDIQAVYTTDQSLLKDQDDEFLRGLPATGEIDLSEDVRQMLLLQIPMQLICREECRGLCDQCGMNRNTGSCDCNHDKIDPRWEQLKALKT
jgi:uncharacterized protein